MLDQSTLAPQPAPSLPRVLGLFGAVMLTLSCITPTSSLFIIVPEVLAEQGSGAVIALVAGLVVSAGIAFCYAELGTLVPSSGGEYAMVTTVLGRFAGWVTFGLSASLLVVIPPIIALGTADYLADLFTVDRALAGAVVMLLATVFAVLDVRSNAFITGAFLAVEIIAAAVVAGFGFLNSERDVSVLVSPVVPDGQGGLSAFSAGILMAGLTVTMFSFNGFGSAVYLTEEIKNPRRNVPRTVFWSLGLAGAIIIIPTAAAVLGVGSLDDLVNGTFPDYVRAWTSPGFAAMINLGIAIAILNAVLVMALQNGRVIFASGRDRAWPEPVNRALTKLHPKWGSPWVSTLAIGLPGALMAAVLNIEELLGVTSVILTLVSLVIAVAAIRARSGGYRRAAAWRMPLWPVVPIAVIAALLYALAEQDLTDLAVAGGIIAICSAYYFLYLRPRAASRWVVTAPEETTGQEDER
ncbi:APC family permease [Planobispora longispora]|uniref:Amino acid transporter n=1 Tax=Planobispora longispora TaxID=28887 RepID=A0A8J3W6L3_9ACTN|nr:APC family permease [Planobispora longispora]GIH77703.1 amino acid transporter [Planobispora longispora]